MSAPNNHFAMGGVSYNAEESEGADEFPQWYYLGDPIDSRPDAGDSSILISSSPPEDTSANTAYATGFNTTPFPITTPLGVYFQPHLDPGEPHYAPGYSVLLGPEPVHNIGNIEAIAPPEVEIPAEPYVIVRSGAHRCDFTLENGRICGKEFGRANELVRHKESVHTRQRSVTCTLCRISERYSRRDILIRHLRRAHRKQKGNRKNIG